MSDELDRLWKRLVQAGLEDLKAQRLIEDDVNGDEHRLFLVLDRDCEHQLEVVHMNYGALMYHCVLCNGWREVVDD